MNEAYLKKIIDNLKDTIRIKVLKQMEKNGYRYPGFSSVAKLNGGILLRALMSGVHLKSIDQFCLGICDEVFLTSDLNELDNILSQRNLHKENLSAYLAALYLLGKIDSELAYNLLNDRYFFTEEDIIFENETNMKKDNLLNKNNENIEGKNMKYLGYIDIVKQESRKYYNFYPVMRLYEDRFEEIEYSSAKEIFPEKGNIWLYSNNRMVLQNKFQDNSYYVLDLPEYLLEDNVSTKTNDFNLTNKKVCVDKIVGIKGEISIDKYDIYYLLERDSKIENVDFNYIIVNEELKEDDKVVLKFGNKLIGPFIIESDYTNQKLIINAQPEKNNYIYDTYTLDEGEIDNYIMELRGSYDGWNLTTKKVIRLVSNKFKKSTVDYIPEIKLLEKFSSYLDSSIYKGKISTNQIDSLRNDIMSSTSTLNCRGNAKLTEERITRIMDILENIRGFDGDIDIITNIVSNLLEREANDDSGQFNKVIDKIIKIISEDEELLKRILPQYQITNCEIRELKKEESELKEKIEKLNEQKEVLNNEALDNAYKKNDELKKENDELEKNIEDSKKELENLTSKIKQATETEDVLKAKEYWESSVNELRKEKYKLDIDIEKNLKDIQETVRKMYDGDLTKKIAESITSDYISQAIIDATANNNKNSIEKNYEEQVKSLANISTNNLQDKEMLNFLREQVSAVRDYNINEILNIFICISQGFLTIFSGEPGTGKSSICNIIGHIFGLDNINRNENFKKEYWENEFEANRYIPISVEQGWTSKKDLIGYYNPLTKSFDKAGNNLYPALKILDMEYRKDNVRLPMLVLLDEANLSSIEYYWADFMNLCDENSSISSIDLGNGENIHIPNTLRFLATINNDHTTEMLSPRLIDRAWIITLPAVDLEKIKDLSFDNNDKILPIVWENFYNIFNVNIENELSLPIKEILKEIYKRYKIANISISPRTDKAIKKYCLAAQNVFEGIDETEKAIFAVDFAIAQKLLSKINGNGNIQVGDKTYSQFLSELYAYCKEQNLVHCSDILNRIISKGKTSMEFYSFF